MAAPLTAVYQMVQDVMREIVAAGAEIDALRPVRYAEQVGEIQRIDVMAIDFGVLRRMVDDA